MAAFDVLVLGGGWGGYTAAVRAAQNGLRSALVERAQLGGTCLHRGCIPTKVLLETAELLSLSSRSAEYGLRLPPPELDYGRVQARKREVVGQLYGGLQRLVKASGTTLIEGDGRLVGPDSVEVRDGDGRVSRHEAASIIVATGSRPRALPGLPFDGRRIVDSDQLLELEQPPRSLIVLGAGAVGVEFASCFNDYGAAVTLIELLPAVLPLEDADVSVALGRILQRRGITTLTAVGARLETVEAGEDGVALEIERAGKRELLQAECLLVAIGREPLTRGIGLEEAGVQLERGFVRVDASMRSTARGIFAVGDCNGTLLLAHVAAAQGLLAADRAAGRPSPPVAVDRLPRATYCRPQVASVGLTEAEARAAGREVKIGRAHLRVNGKALINGEPEGFVKVVCDADSGDLLGLHLLGAGVTELVATGSLARFLDTALEELALNVYPHPTLSEAIGEAAQAALRPPVRL